MAQKLFCVTADCGAWRIVPCTSGKRELPRGTSAVGQVPTGQTRNASAAVSAVGDMFVGQDYTCHMGFRKGRSPE